MTPRERAAVVLLAAGWAATSVGAALLAGVGLGLVVGGVLAIAAGVLLAITAAPADPDDELADEDEDPDELDDRGFAGVAGIDPRPRGAGPAALEVAQ